MVAALVGGAAVGAVFGALLKAVLKLKDKDTSYGQGIKLRAAMQIASAILRMRPKPQRHQAAIAE